MGVINLIVYPRVWFTKSVFVILCIDHVRTWHRIGKVGIGASMDGTPGSGDRNTCEGCLFVARTCS